MDKIKRDKVVTCRISQDLLCKIETEAARQHRTTAGLIYSLLLSTFDPEPHGKAA